MGELLSDNIYTGNHRQRSRSRSVSRRRGPGMAGRGGSVKSKDIKVVDLSSMEAFRGSNASPTNTGKKTVATELSSSTEESQMRINRAHDHIHKQQMLEDQRQKQQQLDRGRSRSQSRPRERKSVINNGGRDSRSRSRPRTKSTDIHSDTSRFAGDTSPSKESSLNRAKALLEKMEQQETAKTASSSRGRTRSPLSSRGRSKSRPRIRPDDDDDLGSRIAKLVDDANRHRSRSRPRQKQQEQHQHKRDVNQLQQEQHQHKRDVNQQQRQQQRSGRSRSRPPHSNDARSVRSISRPQEKKSERGEDRRRSRSEKPDSNRQHRGSLRQSMTSHDDRKLEYLEKQLRKYVQVKETIPKSKQLGHKQRRSSNHSSREDHKTLKHHQHDRNRSEKQDGRRNSAARHRSKSPVAEPKRESRLARPKSPYSPGSPGRNVGTSKSKSSAGFKSPYPYQEDDEVSSQSCDSSHDSRDDSDEDDAQESEDEHPQKPKVDKNGCCIYHSFVQLQKKENGGGWTILSRVCAICDKQAREKQTQHGGEQVSLIYVPGGHADELPPRRSGSRQAMVKQGSGASVNRKPAKGESSLTVSVLESDSDEDSSSSSSTDNASDDDEKEDDSTSVNESRRLSSRSMQKNQTEKSSYDIDKIISSADELLDELMYTEISMEDINEEEETDNRGKTARNVNKEKDQKKSSSSGKKSSRNKKPNDGKIDMSKVESALQQIRSRTPPPKRRPTSDTVDPGKARTPPPSHKFVSKPLAPKQQQSRPPPPPPPYQHGQSMAVLNPDPEPELIESELLDCPAQHNYQHQMHAPTMYQIQEPEQQQVYHEHQSYAPELQHPPNSQHQPAQDDKDSDWTKYAVKCSARNDEDASKKKERRKSKISGKVPDKLSHHESRTHLAVKDMPFTDTFGDFGVYTGQVNENGRPDGKGSMKYNNGIFYEGTWTDGSQDEKAATQYDRIRGGFTSWGGKGKVAVKSGQTLPWNAHRKDKHDENEKTNVRGMEWVDLNGDAGRYTGEVNKDELPHGKGIMKYNYGLIAEGEWVSGVLKENPHDRMIAAASGAGGGAVSVMGGPRSVIGGGMSVGPGMGGGMSVGPMLRPPMVVGGGMSVGPGMSIAQGSVYGMPQMMMQPHQVIMMQPQPNTAQQHTVIAQQNAVMKMCSPPSSVYGGGAGSVYGGSALMAQQQMPVNQQQLVPTPNIHTPPIKEITLG